jgi:two-component system response regulator YesN
MINLLIADDEIEILDGIRSVIDWEANDIRICGEASDGRSALELVYKLSPDVVLMDIRMPKLTGLEVLEEIYKDNLNTKCIILSGYDDFYYARKAINLKATDYLLKPCQPNDILEAVLRVKKVIEAENLKETLFDKYKSYFYDNISVLKEKLLREIIYNTHSDYNALEEKMDLYKINLSKSNLLTAVVHIDILNEEGKEFNQIDIETLKIAIKEITEKIIPNGFGKEIFQDNEDIVIILSSEEIINWYVVSNKLFREIKEEIKSQLQVSVTIGIGGNANNVSEIFKSYNEAISAMEAKFFMGEDNLIFFDEITIQSLKPVGYPLNEDIKIINCLSTGNIDTLKSYVDDYFKTLCSDSSISKDYIKYSCLALFGSILRFCLEKAIDINAMFGEEDDWINKINNCKTIFQLQETVLNIVEYVFNTISENKNTNYLIKKAVEYIKDNFHEDINLETIAKNIFITPGYLSLLFKQETGVNFLEYLHKYRIQKAKEYLHNKLLKNYEVSRMVGYTNEKYFSQMFKRYTGLTPTQYKDSIL